MWNLEEGRSTDFVYTFKVGARVLSLCEHISLRKTHPSKLENASQENFMESPVVGVSTSTKGKPKTKNSKFSDKKKS